MFLNSECTSNLTPRLRRLFLPKKKKKKKIPSKPISAEPQSIFPPPSFYLFSFHFYYFFFSFFLSFFLSLFLSLFLFFVFFFIKGCTRGKSSKKREMVINKSLQAMVVENSVQEDSFFFSGKEKFGLFLRGCFFFRKMGHAKQLLLFF